MGRVYLQMLEEQGRDPEFMEKQRLLVAGAKDKEKEEGAVSGAEGH